MIARGSRLRMHHRAAIAAAIAAALLTLLPAGAARAGTYVVRECNHQAPQNHGHEARVTAFPNPGPYAVAAAGGVCASAGSEYAIQTAPVTAASDGQYGLARFVAPEGTKIVGVAVAARLRNEAGHRARLSMANAAGIEKVRIAAGSPGPAGFSHYEWPTGATGQGAYEQFTAGLFCDHAGSSCPLDGDGAKAKADIRNVKLTIRDDVAPTVGLSGDLVSGSWIRGEEQLRVAARDTGGGLRATATTVNSKLVSIAGLPCALIAGTAEASRLSPCLKTDEASPSLDTAEDPFDDGDNEVTSCASDFGESPNVTCVSRTVQVDNTPPDLAFRAQQQADDPELIRAIAGDATAGLEAGSARIELRRQDDSAWSELATQISGGQIAARVDSGAMPAGDYEFRASIEDAAGNRSLTTRRTDGEPMVLRFPLKTPPELSARLGNGSDGEVVAYRHEGEVAGRLLDPSGAPIAGAPVTVTESFAEGSLIETRRRAVETDARGRYRSTLPGGPSRDVAVRYDGSRRYASATEGGLDFDVRGAARLRVSKRRVRAGRRVAFRGRVKRYFARIPARGKLVEVQVRSGHRWTTVQQARGTDRKGRVVLRHRFRGFYVRPTTFTFRLKVTRENGWPYRGAAKSRRQRVTVVPR